MYLQSKPDVVFDDEELSRVLSEHAAGNMKRGGNCGDDDQQCCILQAAWGWDTYLERKDLNKGKVMAWFDTNYQPTWKPETFVKKLRKQGFVK